MRISLLFPVFSFTSICSAQLKPCYDVHGKPISQIPCDPSANVSACCVLGGICVTNLHCHGSAVNDDTFQRVGGCTDKTGNDPACPLPFLRDPSVWNWFGYTQNTTNCGDGTFCMDPGNETCCFSHEGIKEITYHNTATIPTVAEAWTTYYEDAGYSIPTTTSDPSTSTFLASNGISASSTSTTMPAQSQLLSLSPVPSSQTISTSTPRPTSPSTTKSTISPSEKAIIGTVGALGALGAVGLLYLFRRSRTKRIGQPGSKDTREAHLRGRHELMGHDAGTEMDVGGWNEVTGQVGMVKRAELPG